MSQLRVIDFFCGAGGFSEGFRQQGFDIVMGIDHWRPAIDTFNHNFGLECRVKNMLEFESLNQIEELPNTEVILGSPPCVSFSTSNRSGNADKSMGVKLTEIFLRIVAVKKHQPNSLLKAWFMENVEKSREHLRKKYTFAQLGLAEWARRYGYHPRSIAITLEGNSEVINSADFGGAQVRKRLLSGEIIAKGKFVSPPKTHDVEGRLRPYKTLGDIRAQIPSPLSYLPEMMLQDPNYPALRIQEHKLTDHFYDTGLYQLQWSKSMEQKLNHPYMGKMSFPEREDKPSRTITATKISSSREALIYKSEYNRVGNGEYRTPTVREAATIMGFPITYQLIGKEGAKWRLVGNAVCPCVSSSFAKVLRTELLMKKLTQAILNVYHPSDTPNLNNPVPLIFDNPPKKENGARFRKHPFKSGNMTVTLSNYDISINGKTCDKWLTSVQYGNGKGFPTMNYEDNYYKLIEIQISSLFQGKRFIEIINNGFSGSIAKGELLQKMHDNQSPLENYLDPSGLVEKIIGIIEMLGIEEGMHTEANEVFPLKTKVPQQQLMALYAVNKICSVANQ